MNLRIYGGFVISGGMLLIVSVFLAIAYAALLLLYLYGWRALPEWHIPEDWVPSIRLSVVIAARNEAANIGACLCSIAEGSYPPDLLEIIVVDDHSDDGTAELVRQLKERPTSAIRLISLAEHLKAGETIYSFKKKAIEIGIAQAKGNVIVTTDADCVAPKDWLRWIASRFVPSPGEPATMLLAAPVAFHREHNLLQRFQSLDFLGLMGITGAGIQLGWQRMGNGANLAYPRAVFEAVGGFAGNEHRASGDDMFLIQKIAARWPGSVCFLKTPDATVLTEAKADLRSFLRQRLRWGAKNAALPEWPVRLALLIVFLLCWSILLNALLAVLAGVGVPASNMLPAILLLQVTVKAVFDYLFLREMCRFFKRKDLLRWFVPSFFLHTLYIPFAGTASLFVKKYNWKGRQVG